MRENNLLDFNMYEATLSQNVRQPDGAYAERTYSENAGGGSTTYTFSSIRAGEGTCCYNPVDNDGTFNVTIDSTKDEFGNILPYGSTAILSQPAKKINLTLNAQTGGIYFTPDADFDGFYRNNNKITLTGETIVPGDGRCYKLYWHANGSPTHGELYEITVYDGLVISN